MKDTEKKANPFAAFGGAMRKGVAKIKNFFRTLPARIKEKFAGAKEILTQGNGKVAASMCIMGLGQLLYRQWAKGILYLLVQIAFFAYFILKGAGDFIGFFTLGVTESNAWYGIEGDNSVIMLLMGILSIIALVFYFIIYVANIKDAYRIQCAVDTMKKPCFNGHSVDSPLFSGRTSTKRRSLCPSWGSACSAFCPSFS